MKVFPSRFSMKTTKKEIFLSTALLTVLAVGCASAAEVTAPAEVAGAAPAGTHLVYYKASGSQPDADAVAVYEAAADASGSHKRELLVFRKQDGAFREVTRSDRIVACSTCSPDRGDPFMDGDQLKVTPGHIDIVQVYGDEATTDVTFHFAYDKGQWRVISASRADGGAHPAKLPLPPSGLLKDFDGQWTPTTLWNALAVNDKDHSFRFLMGQPNEEALEAGVKKACSEKGDCRVAARVQDGCLALVRDASGQFFAAASPTTTNVSKGKASQDAMTSCKAKGKGECEAVRADCSAGPI